MKKVFVILSAFVVMLGYGGHADAITTYLDFENPVAYNFDLNSYLRSNLGYNDAAASNITWWENSAYFGSDVLYSNFSSIGGIIDFDSRLSAASTFEITSLSLKWLVTDPTYGIDFGLDVFDDALTPGGPMCSRWIRQGLGRQRNDHVRQQLAGDGDPVS